MLQVCAVGAASGVALDMLQVWAPVLLLVYALGLATGVVLECASGMRA